MVRKYSKKTSRRSNYKVKKQVKKSIKKKRKVNRKKKTRRKRGGGDGIVSVPSQPEDPLLGQDSLKENLQTYEEDQEIVEMKNISDSATNVATDIAGKVSDLGNKFLNLFNNNNS